MVEIETFFQKSSSSETWSSGDSLNLPNRAMNFGDGLFETMVWEKGEVRFLEKHIQRLLGGMEILGFDTKALDATELLEFLKIKFPVERKRVRLNVFRDGAGKYTPESSDVLQTLQISDFTSAPSIKQKADVSLKVQLFPTLWSSFKSLNSLPYVLANQERRERELDEIILLDYRGFVSEAGASNIFWVKEGTFYTPSMSCSCINGVSRQVILEYLERNKIPFEEGEFQISELKHADHVFVSNCTGISYLGSLLGKKFSTTPFQFLKLIFE